MSQSLLKLAMGNFLQSLQAPPLQPDEDERNDPAYYDWSVPKWTPFRQDAADAAASPTNNASNASSATNPNKSCKLSESQQGSYLATKDLSDLEQIIAVG